MTLKEYLERKTERASSHPRMLTVWSPQQYTQSLTSSMMAQCFRNEGKTHPELEKQSLCSYMFIEEGYGYKGIRLYLKKIKEDTDNALIDTMKRRHLTPEEDKAKGPKFLIHFRVDRILPLIGEGDTGIALK